MLKDKIIAPDLEELFSDVIMSHFLSVLNDIVFTGAVSLADPGFGQGGPQKFFPIFCRCSEAESGE